MIRITILTILVSALAIGMESARAQNLEGSKAGSERPRKPAVVPGDRGEAVQKHLDDRESLVDWCLETLNSDPSPYDPKRATALGLLGVLHAGDHPEALKVLVDNLSFHFPTPHNDSPLLGFKAAESMVNIGSVVLPHLFEKLRGESSSRDLHLAAFVIYRIDGVDLGRARLKIAIDDAVRAESGRRDASDRYSRNLKRIDSWFSDPHFFENMGNWPAAHSP